MVSLYSHESYDATMFSSAENGKMCVSPTTVCIVATEKPEVARNKTMSLSATVDDKNIPPAIMAYLCTEKNQEDDQGQHEALVDLSKEYDSSALLSGKDDSSKLFKKQSRKRKREFATARQLQKSKQGRTESVVPKESASTALFAGNDVETNEANKFSRKRKRKFATAWQLQTPEFQLDKAFELLGDNWPAIKAVLEANHIASKEITRMHIEFQKMHSVASEYCTRNFSPLRPLPSPTVVPPPPTNASFLLDNISLDQHYIPSPSHDALFPTEEFSSDEEMFASFT